MAEAVERAVESVRRVVERSRERRKRWLHVANE